MRADARTAGKSAEVPAEVPVEALADFFTWAKGRRIGQVETLEPTNSEKKSGRSVP
jgi:hypothetical protein